MSSPFVRKVQNLIHEHTLIKPGGSYLVAVSGGPDSVCLLDIFASLAPKYDLNLHIAHVNYGLRGRDSDRDQHFVEKLSKKYSLPLYVTQPNTTSLKNKSEEVLRTLRYAFFQELVAQKNLDGALVAHTMNDQAETLLLRLFRGAGLTGLSAMLPKNKTIIRPLLNSSRAEILKYLQERNLSFRIDATNLSPEYTRNFIRLEILPKIQEINPSIIETLAQTAVHVGQDYEYILSQIKKAPLAIKEDQQSFSFSTAEFLALPLSLQRNILRKLIKDLKKTDQNIDARAINEMRKVISSRKPRSAQSQILGLKLTRKSDTVMLLFDDPQMHKDSKKKRKS